MADDQALLALADIWATHAAKLQKQDYVDVCRARVFTDCADELRALATRAPAAAMPESGEAVALPEKITLQGQWKCDGTVEAFRLDGMMVVPQEDGVVYVTKKQAIDFFGLIASPPAKPAAEHPNLHCQNGHGDICRASQRDGIVCPPDSCDIDDDVRPKDKPAADDMRAVDGWVVVPREATMQMRSGRGIHHVAAANLWTAMIEAAPTAPALASLNEPSGNSGQLGAAPALVVKIDDEQAGGGCG